MGQYSYLGLSLFFLLLAGYFVYRAKQQDPPVNEDRLGWATEHNFAYRTVDRNIARLWRRGPLEKVNPDRVRDVAAGSYIGENAVLFDIKGASTIVAVRRPIASGVIIDIRPNGANVPNEAVLRKVVSGPRYQLFSNNADVATRFADPRYESFLHDLPKTAHVVWNEGPWAVGSFEKLVEGEDLDAALDSVRRFSDLVKVLPPRQKIPHRMARTGGA